MFTKEQIEALYSRVLDRMVLAGWVHRYTFTDGKGLRVAWTDRGAIKAIGLGVIVDTFGLHNGDRGGELFDKAAHGEGLPDGTGIVGDIPDSMYSDWRAWVGELGLRGDADGLFGMVHIVREWGPSLDTPFE